MRHLAIDTLRMRRTDPVEPARLEPMMAFGVSEGPERAAEQGEDTVRLRSALGDLPAEQRRAVVLAAYGGLSASEVAVSEGIPSVRPRRASAAGYAGSVLHT